MHGADYPVSKQTVIQRFERNLSPARRHEEREPSARTISARVPIALYRWYFERARERHTSVSAEIETALQQHMQTCAFSAHYTRERRMLDAAAVLQRAEITGDVHGAVQDAREILEEAV